jgi:hypothetical protein
MKASLIVLVMLPLMGCASTLPTSSIDVPQVATSIPADAHLMWCKGSASSCFESAGAFCASDEEPTFSSRNYPHTQGKWHLVPEVGMAFPAMIQDNDGWHMLVVCD